MGALKKEKKYRITFEIYDDDVLELNDCFMEKIKEFSDMVTLIKIEEV